MNVTEMTEALHTARVPSDGPDLDAIRRRGRHIVVRRRAAGTATVAVAAAAMAALLLVPAGEDGRTHLSPATQGVFDDSPEHQFETTAPLGTPVSAVAQVDMKFYLGPRHTRSVGALAFWAEAGTEPERIAYGARLIDLDDTLRRAGYLDVPVLPRRSAQLVRVPGQNSSEPTYVGLVSVPTGSSADEFSLDVRAKDTLITTGTSTSVVRGYLLVWFTATDGHEAGIDLRGFTVRGPGDQIVAQGSFDR